MSPTPFEAAGAVFGLVGAYILAGSGKWAPRGWLLFLASNAALLTFAWLAGHWWLFAQQAGFTYTSCRGIWTHLLRRRLYWSEWRGDFDGNPTMWIMTILHWRGRRLDLHKMVGADMPECFHTHPARALRFVLWGGYDEEILVDHPVPIVTGQLWREQRRWLPGMVGLVRPQLAHRIARLRNGRVSYSLWLRGRKTASTHLVGAGWGEREGSSA